MSRPTFYQTINCESKKTVTEFEMEFFYFQIRMAFHNLFVHTVLERGSWSKIRQKWPILVKTFEFLPYGNNHYFFPRWEGVVSKKSFLDGRGHWGHP